MDAMGEYRKLEKKLAYTRWLNDGLESEEEDCILDDIDAAWTDLSESEKDLIRGEGPKTFIRKDPAKSVRRLVDTVPGDGVPARKWVDT